MLLNEDFARCTECENPWFEPKCIVAIAKGSHRDGPIEIRQKTQYKCTKCGSVQYETDEEV